MGASSFRIATDPRAFAAARRMVLRDCGGERLGEFFLPAAKREGMNALLAFVHLIAQALRPPAAIDGGGGGGGGSEGGGGEGDGSGGGQGCCSGGVDGGVADAVRGRVDDVFAGRVELPAPEFRDEGQWALAAFAATVRRFELPREPMIDFVQALAADAAVTRYATWRSLGEHCRRTGGSVAVLATAVLGATHSDAAAFARLIGQATRLVGIVRDVKRDALRGRVYVPAEDLARCRYAEKDLLAGRVTPAAEALVRLETARARELLSAGSEGVCWLAGDGSRAAAAAFVAEQLAVLDALDHAPADVLIRGSVRVSPARRLRRLPGAWRLAQRQASEPLPKLG